MNVSIKIKDQIFIIYGGLAIKRYDETSDTFMRYTFECFEAHNINCIFEDEQIYISLYKEAIKKFIKLSSLL